MKSVLCQVILSGGRIYRNSVLCYDDDSWDVIPFSIEVHSTTMFNGIAVILPAGYEHSLPSAIRSSDCGEFIKTVSRNLPRTVSPIKVHFIPFIQ